MKEKWTEDIRERLDGHRMKEPDGLWKDISDALKKEYGNKPAAKGRLSRPMYLVSRIAAAAAVIAAIFVCFQVLDKETYKEKVATLAKEKPAGTQMAKEPSRHGKNTIDKILVMADGTTATTKQATSVLLYDDAADHADCPEEQAYAKMPTDSVKNANVTPTATKEKLATKDDHKATKANHKEYTYMGESPVAMQTRRKVPQGKSDRGQKGVELGITASNGIGTGSDKGGSTIHPLYAFAPTMNDADYIFTQKTSYSHKERTAKHDLPLKLGLSVRYNVNSKWSVESGLTYTRLRSTFKENGELQYRRSVQRLNYIGIPAGVAYSLWSSGRLNVYVAAGGEVAKCISGKVETEAANINETSGGENTKGDTERPWLFSVNAAAGIQFSIIDGLSLYAEPGIGYYFDSNSETENYYSEHPFSPSIKLGLRLQLPF